MKQKFCVLTFSRTLLRYYHTCLFLFPFYTRLTGILTKDSSIALSSPFIVEQSNGRPCVLAFSRTLLRYYHTCLFLFPLLACCYWFTWIVFDVFVSVDFVRNVSYCVCFHCFLVIYLFYTPEFCSGSFCLLFSCEMILGSLHLRNNFDKRYFLKLCLLETS